ncbi:MAG: hypothetical protein FJ039_08330 [Chloroflexi bacterium]|nr:hypothetical protein [Chloroflexota bacterium]
MVEDATLLYTHEAFAKKSLYGGINAPPHDAAYLGPTAHLAQARRRPRYAAARHAGRL